MKFRTRTPHCKTPGVNFRRAGFTLAEVLAALAFMAIVIPVAVQGLRIASRALKRDRGAKAGGGEAASEGGTATATAEDEAST